MCIECLAKTTGYVQKPSQWLIVVLITFSPSAKFDPIYYCSSVAHLRQWVGEHNSQLVFQLNSGCLKPPAMLSVTTAYVENKLLLCWQWMLKNLDRELGYAVADDIVINWSNHFGNGQTFVLYLFETVKFLSFDSNLIWQYNKKYSNLIC